VGEMFTDDVAAGGAEDVPDEEDVHSGRLAWGAGADIQGPGPCSLL